MERISTMKRSMSIKQGQTQQSNRLQQATKALDEMSKVNLNLSPDGISHFSSKIIDEISSRCFPIEGEDRRSTSSTDRPRSSMHETPKIRDEKAPSLLSMFKKSQHFTLHLEAIVRSDLSQPIILAARINQISVEKACRTQLLRPIYKNSSYHSS